MYPNQWNQPTKILMNLFLLMMVRNHTLVNKGLKKNKNMKVSSTNPLGKVIQLIYQVTLMLCLRNLSFYLCLKITKSLSIRETSQNYRKF